MPNVPEAFKDLPKTKKEAVENGVSRYFDGSTCRNGHTADRYVNGGCVVCVKARARARDPIEKAKRKLATQQNLDSIHRQCKRETCENWFTPANRKDQVFCSEVCADIQGKRDWKKRNKDHYLGMERKRKKKKYQSDSSYREIQKERSNRIYHALSDEEKYERNQRARSQVDIENHRKYAREWAEKRYLSDHKYRLVSSMRARLRQALKSRGGAKKVSTIEYLGCSIDEFAEYFEGLFLDGMTWENFGEWHIDHIKPCAAFPNLATDESEKKECFHYSNLQPLWKVDNLRKGSKYDGD